MPSYQTQLFFNETDHMQTIVKGLSYLPSALHHIRVPVYTYCTCPQIQKQLKIYSLCKTKKKKQV